MKTKCRFLSVLLALVMVLSLVPAGIWEVSAADSSKIDVWDFAAEQLDPEKYNNMLTADEINGWFPGVEPGTLLATTGGFTTTDGQLQFVGGGKTNHRLRLNSNIKGITCYDVGKYLMDDNGTTYNGYIYSNSGGNTGVRLCIQASAGDILTFVHGSNGTAADVHLEAPSGAVTDTTFVPGDSSKHAQISTFYVAETGVHQFYYSSEKLVVARIYRQHTNPVPVTGKVTAPEELTDYSVVFTCNESGAVIEAPVVDGAYSASLNDSYTYTLSLKDADGYVITSDKTLAIEAGAASASKDVEIQAVPQVAVSGNIVGLSQEALANLKLSFLSDEIYNPAVTINGSSYALEAEVGVTYNIVADGVNDYALTSTNPISYTQETVADLVFEAKPVYAITIDPQGATLADLANATFTFTNLNEEGYVYTFTGTENIALRDGVYSVKVGNSGAFVQQLTANLTVNGGAVTKTIPFSSDISVWDFSASDFAEKVPGSGAGSYNGLTFTNGQRNGKYLLAKPGTVSIPVKGACQIVVSATYEYSFYFESDTEASVGVKTGTTGTTEVFTYDYTGGAGTVDITVLGQSYLCKVEIIESVPFKSTVTVGASGCDYTTINDALDAVRAMDRPNNERVTIEIQPGNYEEMLVVDIPNVTLKNASANPSIELTNKGVDIAANAVRITHYYGHGYTYFSMGSDCKYDENLLAVNKENGYASFTNPGTGTTSGSYWNATVVISASGFQAEGIIFENSFNQYVSQKAANDVIVPQSGAKEPASAPRAGLPAGSTAVQDKAYVERAAALAIADNCKEVSFDNCKFIGRQDTLYGGKGATVAFYDCSVYGGCDFIFGGMSAVFAKCDLVMNTSEDGNDKAYITAPQTPSGRRGILLYNCHITSTVPGVDTASEFTSKPGYFGRPWAPGSGEAVFYNTIIDAADPHWNSPSLIVPEGWNNGLSGSSALCGEYGTYEYSGVDNSANRATWAAVFETENLADGKPISVETFLGSWDAFAGKDMTITMPGTEPIDPNLNGLVKAEDGGYNYYVNGVIDTEFVGLVDNAFGTWYVAEGKIQFGYNGLITFEGKTYDIHGGQVNVDKTGLVKRDGAWYYVAEGVVDAGYTGFCQHGDFTYYVVDGSLNFNLTDVIEVEGEKCFIKYGHLASDYTGLVKGSDGVWRYVAEGVFDATYTGIAKGNDGVTFYYVQNGLIDFKFSGTVEVDGVSFTVRNGVVITG